MMPRVEGLATMGAQPWTWDDGGGGCGLMLLMAIGEKEKRRLWIRFYKG